jgi:hypothetical protein
MTPSSLLIALLLCFVVGSAQAQTVSDPARAVSALPAATATTADSSLLDDDGAGSFGTHAAASPGDSDLGEQSILARKADVEAFTLSADAQYFWTDNAANVSAGELEDSFLSTGAALLWQQPAGKRWILDASLSQRLIRYEDNEVLDYENAETMTGAYYALPWGKGLLLHAHYHYQRITTGMEDEPLYQAHTARLGGDKIWNINRRNTIRLALLAALAMQTEPENLTRNEYSGMISYNLKLTRQLSMALSYRSSLFEYQNFNDRQDWFHNISPAIVWRPTKWLDVALTYSFTLNNSSLEFFDYQSQLAGPALSFHLRF